MWNFFKPKKSIQSEIQSDLKNANRSIKVAVSWLTDPVLITTLIKKVRQGVDVKILLSSNELNILRFELFREIQKLGGKVQKWGNAETEKGGFMHYKFYVIDDAFAKSGSYNWSINATTNAEALDKVEVNEKLDQFNDLWVNSKDFFYQIDNPEQKRAELENIRTSRNLTILSPETLIAVRAAEQEVNRIKIKHDAEKRQRDQDNETLKAQLEIEKKEREKLEREKKAKAEEAQYKPKEGVKTTTLPPTSYGYTGK
ncbi:MAG: hypothetical protein H6571_09820 [Lewinellaceae bacterium]|nr:hypothetical protein [Lewinellaceae bacterium]